MNVSGMEMEGVEVAGSGEDEGKAVARQPALNDVIAAARLKRVTQI